LDYHSAGSFIENFGFTLLLAPAGTTILVFLLTVLFVISFMVAGAEVAFFSMTFKDVNMLKTHQQPAYRRIVTLLEQPKTLLASMLITNSFVNIGIILIANTLIDGLVPGLDKTDKTWAVFLVKVLVVTIFLLLFAEVLPKVWATNQKLRFASTASLLIEICNSICYRMSKRLVRFTDRVEKRFSPEKNISMDSSHLDDAIDLLPEHEATMEEKQILKGIRKFGDTTVKQVMRTRLDVSGVAASSSFADVIARVEELHYSRLPVYKNNLDEIAGMLHTKDLLPHLHEAADYNWHGLMRQAFFVHEQKLIEDLLQEFRNRHIHFAVVVDEFGGTSGIVTLEDIMEEIIGDIKDEFDDEENINKKIDDNTYLFEGKTMINDVCKAMQLAPDTFEKVRGESDSLAGLVLEIAGEFPQVNEEVSNGDFTFVPLAINKNRIEKIKVIIRPAEG
jgi:putative hemolysin